MVMRCAGCGGLVSEWAARCPECGRSTDDAASVTDLAATVAGQRPGRAGRGLSSGSGSRVTAGSRSRRRVAVVLAAVVGGSALGFGVAIRAASGTRGHGGRIELSGEVAALAPGGDFSVSRFDGTQQRMIAAGTSGVSTSADRRFLATRDGVVFAVRGASIGQFDRLALGPGMSTARFSAFADGDRALLVIGEAASARWPSLHARPITLIDLRDHRAESLGAGDSFGTAADPRTRGAFVPVVAAAADTAPVIERG